MDNKNTVSAICPHCGSQQEVDPTQDAAICRYCGKPFSVQKAVNTYGERYLGTRQSGMDNRTYASPGPTYYAEPQKPKKRRTFWWVVGWIFCFPIPLTILVVRSRKLSGIVKAVIIAAAWIVYLALGAYYRTNTGRTPASTERTPAVVQTTYTPRPTARPTATPKPTATPEPAEEETEVDEAAEETPEPTPEPTPAPAGVTPEFKAAMDSYEAFFDEYCEFMKTMADEPTDLTILMEYADVMTQYADIMDNLDDIDEDELSPADEAYYIESMARIEVKLLEAANYMSD